MPGPIPWWTLAGSGATGLGMWAVAIWGGSKIAQNEVVRETVKYAWRTGLLG